MATFISCNKLALSEQLKIYHLYCLKRDKKYPDGKTPYLELWALWITPLMPLLPGPLWIVALRVLFMSQIDLFENYLLKIEIPDTI